MKIYVLKEVDWDYTNLIQGFNNESDAEEAKMKLEEENPDSYYQIEIMDLIIK